MKKLEDYSKEGLPYVVDEMIAKHDTGFISGNRKDWTRSENNETELKISTYLRHKGYSLVRAKGRLGRDSESSDAAGYHLLAKKVEEEMEYYLNQVISIKNNKHTIGY